MSLSLELPFGDGLAQGRVTKRARDNDGNVIGGAHENPIVDTRKYVVEVENGEEAELSANAIVQSMYAQCNPEGNQYVLLTLLLTIGEALHPYLRLIKRLLRIMVEISCGGLLKAGSFVFSRRIAAPRGRGLLT